MTPPVRSYIGIGSNLDNPSKQVKLAIASLKKIPQTRLTAHSSLYQTSPMGPQNQPDYINAVAEIETGLPAEKLLLHLQSIEKQQGRQRSGERWGARTIDLDLLLYGKTEKQSTTLTIPHPGICSREFVLIPLLEIAPDLEIPGLGKLQKIIDNRDMDDLNILEEI